MAVGDQGGIKHKSGRLLIAALQADRDKVDALSLDDLWNAWPVNCPFVGIYMSNWTIIISC